jgi:tRNA A37 threonylcarbamoyladenosine modification protein TsaB
MEEVYLGIFERGAGELPVAVETERLHGVGIVDALRDFDAGGVYAAGFGWERYPGLLTANRDFLEGVAEARFPRGRDLLPLGAAVLADGAAVEPRLLAPEYLRDEVAAKPGDPRDNSR